MDKRFKDHTGEKYGMLTVLEKAEDYKITQKYKCMCKCGNITYSTIGNMKKGKKVSCGCLKNNDLSGEKFGRLTVVKRWERLPSGHTKWLCVCDCGNVKFVMDSNLHRKHEVSCGCAKKEKMIKNSKWKGESSEPLFIIWRAMLKRCYNINSQNYKYYGGRGIKVCNEWLDENNGYFSFKKWSLENGFEKGLSIERIDVNNDYSPDNCKWIPFSEQSKNKRNNNMITYHNETKCLAEWSKILGIKRYTLYSRLKRGWAVEKAFETPVNV